MNKQQTASEKKRFGMVILAILAGALLLGGVSLLAKRLLRKEYGNSDFGITTYVSSVDKDGDGVDDQTDILESVREYLVTKPKYKSKYYAGGYPDDEYGVCTDVIAFGLKGAGYDLMELVDQDIREHQEEYGIDVVDKNIDFRRVGNLDKYFRNKHLTLTTDLKDIAEWQAGDIVVFRTHIGIVSDKRNKKGIPYLIHHYSPLQLEYEEDALERWSGEIIGHYRVS